MRILTGTIAFALLSASSLVQGQSKPSFNCAKAQGDVEKTICNNNHIAVSDALIAQQLARANRAFDAATKKALKEDQQYFIGVRDEGFGHPWDGRTPVEWLTLQLEERADFLHSLKATPNKGVLGHWGNYPGGVDIEAVGNGTYKVRLNAVDPLSARWVCDVDAMGKLRNGVLTVEDPEIEGWQITMRRQGSGLVVKEVAKPGTKTDGYSPYCGMNGYVKGTYFPLTRSTFMAKD